MQKGPCTDIAAATTTPPRRASDILEDEFNAKRLEYESARHEWSELYTKSNLQDGSAREAISARAHVRFAREKMKRIEQEKDKIFELFEDAVRLEEEAPPRKDG